MRIRLAFVAITIVTLGAVACQPDADAPPSKPVTVLPSCLEEDGSGQGPCLWTDPDTGRQYRNN